MMDARLSLTARELKKWVRNPLQMIIMIIQPLFWIFLFGSAFNITNLVPSNLPSMKNYILNTYFMGAKNYISFLTPGMLAIMALFTAMFSGVSLIWDRRFGYLTRLLSSPIPRDSIVFSKVFSATVKGTFQSTILLVIAIVVPGGLYLTSNFTALNLVMVYMTLIMLSFGFSGLFSLLSVRIKTIETLMAIVNLLNLPLMFTSSAMFAQNMMPDWLKDISSYNPVTWAANTMRYEMIGGIALNSTIITNILYLLLFDIAVLILIFAVSRYGFSE